MADRYQPRPPSTLEPDQRALYDAIVDGPRGSRGSVVPIVHADGSLAGPFGPMTLAPKVGHHVQALGAALRFETDLADGIREAAILAVAAHQRSEFEWFAHSPAATQAGLSSATLTALRDQRVPAEFSELDQLTVAVVQQLLHCGDLTDEFYRSALDRLGERVLAQLVWLVGYYSMLALALRVFDPPIPSNASQTFRPAQLGTCATDQTGG